MNLIQKEKQDILEGIVSVLNIISDPKQSKSERWLAGETLKKSYGPGDHISYYANAIRHPDITDNARWIGMLMLYYVGNQEAVTGFISFIEDPNVDASLKLSATTLLFSLTPCPEMSRSADLPKFPLRWVQNGLEQLPGEDEDERREYVIKQLLINLFEEGSG